jgi:electron transfer flavoprotein alpha subunit
MEKILFLAHTESDGSLGKPALEALGAALALKASLGGAELAAGLIGENVQAAANQIAACGAVKFLGVAGPAFGVSRYATDALAAETIVKAAQAALVIAPATQRLARCLAGVAQRVGGVADTHVAALSAEGGKVAISRWYYRQRMEAVLRRTARPWFLLIDPGSQPAWTGGAGTATVELLAASVTDAAIRTTVAGIREPAASAKTIRPESALLFVAGAGWTKKQADGQAHVPEAEKCIRDFLTATQASLGSTKSLVDQSGEGQAVLSFLTHMNQIGQTGATPRHAKGLSTCCHGEEPHTVGWRFIKERRAISLDPNCGWARGKADVLYVADAFKVMAKVNAILGAKG